MNVVEGTSSGVLCNEASQTAQQLLKWLGMKQQDLQLSLQSNEKREVFSRDKPFNQLEQILYDNLLSRK